MSNKKFIMILLMFLLVTTFVSVSFSLFSYRRTSITKVQIIPGQLEFAYIEGENANLSETYPVADKIGASDPKGEYIFDVSLNASKKEFQINYDVYFLDNNEGDKIFKNEQIKYALIKNGNYVNGTSEERGLKLSTINGFNEGTSSGYGEVLDNQEIKPGETDRYILRIWISDDVNYSNTEIITDGTDEYNDTNESIGKYSGYTYSLKVKINGQVSTTRFTNLNIDEDGMFSLNIEDDNGIKAYAIKEDNESPTQNDWIDVSGSVAKSNSNITKVANNIVTNKKVQYNVDKLGTYYVYAKNNLNIVAKKMINITRLNVIVYLDANGGEVLNDSVKVSTAGTYTDLPSAKRNGYNFLGWYTSKINGRLANNESNFSDLNAKTLYAHWEKGIYTLTINPNDGTYDGSTGNKTEQVEFQDTYTLKTPTRRGYDFDG